MPAVAFFFFFFFFFSAPPPFYPHAFSNAFPPVRSLPPPMRPQGNFHRSRARSCHPLRVKVANLLVAVLQAEPSLSSEVPRIPDSPHFSLQVGWRPQRRKPPPKLYSGPPTLFFPNCLGSWVPSFSFPGTGPMNPNSFIGKVTPPRF